MIYFEYGFLWLCIVACSLMGSGYCYLMFVKKEYFEFQNEIYKLVILFLLLVVTIHFVRN